MRREVAILRFGVGLDLSPVAVEHVLASIDQPAGAGHRRLMQFYDALLKKKGLLLSTANPNPQMLLDEIMMEMQDLYRKKD